MGLQLERDLDYSGHTGVNYLRCLQQDLAAALQESDWDKVRFLDQACAVLVERVIAANRGNGPALVLALNELKNVYARMIMQCKYEVNSFAH